MNQTFNKLSVIAIVMLMTACQSTPLKTTEEIAEDYILTGLSLGQLDQKLPFIYIGDEKYKTQANALNLSLPEISERLISLKNTLAALPATKDIKEATRRTGLHSRLVSMHTRTQILQGQFPATFDDETRLLFGVEVAPKSEAHFKSLVDELNDLIPGSGPLSSRMEAFREQFRIPTDKLEDVILFSIKECRARTKKHIDLPDYEKITLQVVTDQPYVGFTYIQGHGQSSIAINADIPVHIERALELGCHEGYPGHHVFATLIEKHAIVSRNHIEWSLVPLYGMQALITEGTATYAPELAFPGSEKSDFEKHVLLPMAGLSGDNYDTYLHYLDIKQSLNYARNEVARKYLYEDMSRTDAVQWLMDFGLETKGTAEQRLDFIDTFRTYVISYNYGYDVVKVYIEKNYTTYGDDPWAIFEQIMQGNIATEDIINAIEQE